MVTMLYKWMTKCPIQNIPDKELFSRLMNQHARKELMRRGYDVHSIIRANKSVEPTASSNRPKPLKGYTRLSQKILSYAA